MASVCGEGFPSLVFAFLFGCCCIGLSATFNRDVLDKFHTHAVVQPTIYTEAREKRDVRSTTVHDEKLALLFVAFGKNFAVDLRMNTDLLPEGYFEKHHENGSHVIKQPMKESGKHCHYQGDVKGCKNSWAAISTCNGISGVIYDGNEMHFIEPGDPSDDDRHFVFRASDMKPHNMSCGTSVPDRSSERPEVLHEHQKHGFSGVLPSPYKSNNESRYVELVIVNDKSQLREFNGSKAAVFDRSKQIANIVNGLYSPLNVFVALVGVIIWSDHDEIFVSADGDNTLANFIQYRRERLAQKHPNDNAQLLTSMAFEGGIVSKALTGTICTHSYSAGVNRDSSPVVGLVATTVAHALGHNFGMQHDTAECRCPEENCIMAPTFRSSSTRQWSSCSREYLQLAFSEGLDYCLKDRPYNVTGPVCGNGFLEEGEECDCGLNEFCESNCCNASSCKLFRNATCATGDCCDHNTCQLKKASTPCRDAASECDLPEYCDGASEFCPSDTYLQNGMDCGNGKAYCFDGQCRSHTDQCKLLWGETGRMSHLKCYELNVRGTRMGNCGYNMLNETYKSCRKEDILCGMLHCSHLNERLEFGKESTSILVRSFINSEGKILACRSAIIDLGLSYPDPGLTPNGAKCGDGKVCANRNCVPISSIQKPDCPSNCTGNGVCNNKGHCHCEIGYSPPYCDSPGPGGSSDSGPASESPVDTSFVSRCKKHFFALFSW